MLANDSFLEPRLQNYFLGCLHSIIARMVHVQKNKRPVHKSEDVTSQTHLQLGSQSIGQASSSHRIQSQTTKLR